MEKQNKQLLTESSRYATAAVKYDSSGDHERAFEFYLMTVQLLSICISNETNPKTKQALANRANEYLLRAEQIKEKLRNQPKHPQKPKETSNSQHVPPQNEMKQTNKVDSSTTPTENESTLTDSLKSAATTGAIALKESGVHIYIGDGLKYLYSKAREMDDKYELHQKALAAAKTGFEKAREIDKEYQIHQKVGQGISSGFNIVTSATKAYIDADVPQKNLPSNRQNQESNPNSNENKKE